MTVTPEPPFGDQPAEPEVSFESAIPFSPASRSMPHSLESELALLGCCLLDRTETADASIEAGVNSATFYETIHRQIWDSIAQLRRTGDPCESALIRLLMQSAGTHSPASIQVISAASSSVGTSAPALGLIRSLLDLQGRRAAIRAAHAIIEDAKNPAITIDQIVADAHRAIKVPSAQTTKGFLLWRPAEFIAFQPDPSGCLLGDGFVERGEWTSFVGVGGLGKTRLALYFAICQITGREFCGLPTKGKPQHAIILSTENGLRRWKHDIERFYYNLTKSEQDLVNQHLRIQALTAQDDGDLNLGIPATVARLCATLKSPPLTNPSDTPGTGLVIFDPFADMVNGDENKTTDLVQTLQTLRRITTTACPDAAIIIIHHARTGAANVAQAGDNYNAGNFGRGSKALFSKVRCELQLAPQDRDDPSRLVLACGKANNTVKFTTRGIKFDADAFTYREDPDFDLDAWRDDVAGKRSKSVFTIKDAVSIVREKSTLLEPEVSSDAILRTAIEEGVSKATLYRILQKANDAGYIRKGKTRGMWMLGSKPISEL